ncbi:hypothetical protein TorRG33x02_100520 [Trema orientale]|uniref:Hydroxyproline-rich glycoprotein family protein n=1 Tax=Trema orientale TaxID=63057 RepID=A0A2P5F883_TREOI|nr:hypothetical protein TorRG33x02_100520 [Trema orientale]
MLFEKLVFFIALWLSAFNLGFAGDDPGDEMPSPTGCLNCTICPYLCQPLSPPASGYPSYGPPPPPPSLPEYPSYGAPPPPQSNISAQGKCPPTPAVQCCQYPPPTPYGGYVPYESHAPQSPIPIFPSFMILLFSSVVLF